MGNQPVKPEEKANDLIEMFRKVGCRSTDEAEIHSAIQSSIIAVEEIILHMVQDDLDHEDCHNLNSKWMGYWYDVLGYLKRKL